MPENKVLVLNATGKVGQNVCRALKEAGFDVYGTTRNNIDILSDIGIHPVLCDYTKQVDLERVIQVNAITRIFAITDYFGAAKSNPLIEIEHGMNAINAAKNQKIEHLIFVSVIDAEFFNKHVKHIKTKLVIEEYLKKSGIPFSILRPTAFFENFDDAKNWNPLKKGKLKFLTDKHIKYCATYDIGRAAAVIFKNPNAWLGKTLDVIGWEGSLKDVAKALEKVGGVPVKYSLALPIFLRRLFLKDLHHMFLYFEAGGPKGSPEEFKKVVPDALSAEDWFRFHEVYSNGEKIVS